MSTRLCGFAWTTAGSILGSNHGCGLPIGHDGPHRCHCEATTPRVCVDCHDRPAADGKDACQPCQDAVDELEAEREDCEDNHGSHCGCWRIGAIARVLAVVEPVGEVA